MSDYNNVSVNWRPGNSADVPVERSHHVVAGWQGREAALLNRVRDCARVHDSTRGRGKRAREARIAAMQDLNAAAQAAVEGGVPTYLINIAESTGRERAKRTRSDARMSDHIWKFNWKPTEESR